jgi:ribonucleoside-diphosphate reductase alpha chain
MKFLNEDGSFKTNEFKHTVDIFILAQEILVGGSSYPTELIVKNARAFRELGLGFANLGAFLMTKGIAYDSEKGRAWAGAISSLLSGEAYRYSAQIAGRVGAFEGYKVNREPMLSVIKNHGLESKKINRNLLKDKKFAQESLQIWHEAYVTGKKLGFRNSQVTVIAPTGTISFMMDCDTTGIEPDFSLVKKKQLVGGGWMKIVNESVEGSLLKLGYTKSNAKKIVEYIAQTGMAEGAPGLKEEHLSIFDCAMKSAQGTRAISWKGHVRMVAAVQPFISGAISKTFNMSNEVTKEEIEEAYVMAWKLGIKAFAVYRDGSKATQPLSSGGEKKEKKEKKEPQKIDDVMRQRLPATRTSLTHRFSVAGHKGYLTYSTYENGRLAEIFIRMAKQGSTLSGLLDAFAISVSMALQYGVPLKALAHKFIYSRFEPAGFTENQEIRMATSIVDYIFRFLALSFLQNDELAEFGIEKHLLIEESVKNSASLIKEIIHESSSITATLVSTNSEGDFVAPEQEKDKKQNVFAGTVCRNCGGMMVRTGTCMTCGQCGTSSGGCS